MVFFMDKITIYDKEFVLTMPEEDILQRIDSIAQRINNDLAGRNPLFLIVLNGAFMFAADLLKRVTIPCELSFVKLASYQGTTSTGTVKEVIGINEDLSGRTIVIVEDIVDTGRTMAKMIETLGTRNPREVLVCTLFVKPHKIQFPITIHYAAIELADDFIVGYGLDYQQQGRNLKDLYTLATDNRV